LRELEAAGGPACGSGRALPLARRRLRPRALFEDVLDVCRVACAADLERCGDGVDDDAVPEELEGDPERLAHALHNVAVVCVGAAGARRVRAQLLLCCADEEDEGADANAAAAAGDVRVCARFTALGLAAPPAALVEALDAFEHGAAGEAYASGARLALLVARSLARALGGDLFLAAAREGTTFELRVRLFRPGTGPPPAEQPPSPRAASPRSPPRPWQPEAQQQQPAEPDAQPEVALTGRMMQFLIKNSDECAQRGCALLARCSADARTRPCHAQSLPGGHLRRGRRAAFCARCAPDCIRIVHSHRAFASCCGAHAPRRSAPLVRADIHLRRCDAQLRVGAWGVCGARLSEDAHPRG
jgi:hypothetical protein